MGSIYVIKSRFYDDYWEIWGTLEVSPLVFSQCWDSAALLLTFGNWGLASNSVAAAWACKIVHPWWLTRNGCGRVVSGWLTRN